MEETVTVVKLYGVNLGEQPLEIEKYWEDFAKHHPLVRFGWFGREPRRLAILYHVNGYHEMYDNGCVNVESMIVEADDLSNWNREWDDPIMDAAEEMGFHQVNFQDCNWKVVVSTFTSLVGAS